MKARIRKGRTFFGPYQLVDKIFFWVKDPTLEDILNGSLDEYEAVQETLKDKVGEWYSESWLGKKHAALANAWVNRPLKHKIVIENFDVWSVDHTLSLIIVPMLEKVAENKQGSPCVENDDVPDWLWAPETTEGYDIDENWHKRWEYVLGEMIWAMKEIQESEEKYTTEYQNRMQNGCRLFGKYFRSLWT